jgi:hypothetical protein
VDTSSSKNGDSYEGMWENGQRHGLGIYKFSDDEYKEYRGEYKNDRGKVIQYQ